jgi:pimeloyl-ACP methyl ester carboxylesterase
MHPQGEGALALLLHSGGLSGAQWKKLAAALVGSGHAVWAPDLLGYGESSAWPDDQRFDFHTDVDGAVAMLRAAPGPVHVVGHSYGGFVGALAALVVPEKVRSLALYEPVTFGVLTDAKDAEGLADFAPIFEAFHRFDGAFLGREPAGRVEWLRAFITYWSGPGAFDAMKPPMREGFERVVHKLHDEVMTLIEDRTPRAAYAAVTAPALVMSGERSTVGGRRTAALLAASFAHGRHVELPGAVHMAPVIEADRVNGHILAHIRSVESGASTPV